MEHFYEFFIFTNIICGKPQAMLRRVKLEKHLWKSGDIHLFVDYMYIIIKSV